MHAVGCGLIWHQHNDSSLWYTDRDTIRRTKCIDPLNRRQRLTLTLALTQMLETLSGDDMSNTLLDMGVCSTTRAVAGDLDTHTPCKNPASPVQIQGVHIEVVYGTRGCPGVMEACDYRPELVYVPIVGTYGAIECHEANSRRVGSHPRDNSW